MAKSDDIRDVMWAVSGSASEPTGDARVIAILESFLADKRVGIVGAPYRYGEIRYQAARSLAAERAMLGDEEPFYLEDTFRTMTSSDIRILAIKTGLQVEKSRALEQLRILVEHDAIPRHRKEFGARKEWFEPKLSKPKSKEAD